MTWLKLDDGFVDHPKIVAAGHEAGWLYIAGLCYASRQLTDGTIPAGVLGRLTDLGRPERHAATLVAHGLWAEVTGGWIICSYGEHQRTRAEVEADRDRWRTKKRRQRAASPSMSPRDIDECPPESPPDVPRSETETETETETEEITRSSAISRASGAGDLDDDTIIRIALEAGLDRAGAVTEWARMTRYIDEHAITVANLAAYWRAWTRPASARTA